MLSSCAYLTQLLPRIETTELIGAVGPINVAPPHYHRHHHHHHHLVGA